MTQTNDLLAQTLELLAQQEEGIEFRRGWGGSWASRLTQGPVACGEALSREAGEAGEETVLRLSVFAQNPDQGERAAQALEAAVLAHCPGCVRLRRQRRQDAALGRPAQVLELTFLGESPLGLPVTLGGKVFRAAGYSVGVSQTGRALTAVGEEVPFALEGPQAEYQVELRGLRGAGLERLASFTAQVGGCRYTGCRWKKLDLSRGVGVFTAAGCEEEEA